MSKMLVGTPWSINPKEISTFKKLGCFFSIGKSSVMRKVNFAVGNEVTCRHCYILTGKFMFTLHQEPIQENNQDTPLLKSKTIHGCKKTKINVSCLAQKKPLNCQVRRDTQLSTCGLFNSAAPASAHGNSFYNKASKQATQQTSLEWMYR